MGISDEERMLMYKEQGNVIAFKELYEKYTPELRGYTQNLLFSKRHKIDVEDIVQQTWKTVIERSHHYKPNASFRTYLYVIHKSRIIDFQRSLDAKKQRNEILETDAFDEETDLSNAPILDDENPPLEEDYLYKSIGLKLDLIIQSLPEDQKMVVLLYYYQEFSVNEIAQIMALPVENIKSKIRSAKKKIADQLLKLGINVDTVF